MNRSTVSSMDTTGTDVTARATDRCIFEITRGFRQGQQCRRPIYRKYSRTLCLQHHRAMEELELQKQLGNVPEYEPIRQQAPPKPVDPMEDVTIIQTSVHQDEVLAEGTAEEVTTTLLDMLVKLKKDLKSKK